MLVVIFYIRHLLYRHYVERVEESAENACHISLIVPCEFLRFIVYTIAYHTRLGAVGRRANSTTKATHEYMTGEGTKSSNPGLTSRNRAAHSLQLPPCRPGNEIIL